MIKKSSLRLAIVAATLASALAVTGCSSQPVSTATDTPSATNKASELCVINNTETPLEIRWVLSNMRNDGDKVGKYAITKSNSGKVCGLGSDYLTGDVSVNAGNANIATGNLIVGWPRSFVHFYTPEGEEICPTPTLHHRDYEPTVFECGATRLTVQRQADTDYKNILVTFEAIDPYTPENFK